MYQTVCRCDGKQPAPVTHDNFDEWLAGLDQRIAKLKGENERLTGQPSSAAQPTVRAHTISREDARNAQAYREAKERATPAGRQGMFASLFLDPKPGVERIVVRGTDIPRLADRVERLRIALPPTKFRQEVEVEMLGGGENYFDIAAIEKAVSPMEALCL